MFPLVNIDYLRMDRRVGATSVNRRLPFCRQGKNRFAPETALKF
jgi:hypothetical protein